MMHLNLSQSLTSKCPPSELGVWKGVSTLGETHLQCWRTKLGIFISQMVKKMRRDTLVALKSEVHVTRSSTEKANVRRLVCVRGVSHF